MSKSLQLLLINVSDEMMFGLALKAWAKDLQFELLS